jgi:hypothetical protein
MQQHPSLLSPLLDNRGFRKRTVTKTNRPEKNLRAGDVLIVWKLLRLSCGLTVNHALVGRLKPETTQALIYRASVLSSSSTVYDKARQGAFACIYLE